MEKKRSPNGYWTYDRCIEAAEKCKNMNEYRKKFPGARNTARKAGWISQISLEMSNKGLWPTVRISKPCGYWTYERCLEVAKKYDCQQAFVWNENAAYCALRHNKWIERLQQEMYDKRKWRKPKETKPRGYWTLERCREMAMRCDSLADFKTLYGSVERKMRDKGWLQEVETEFYEKGIWEGDIKHKRPNGYWTYERCKESARQFSSIQFFRKNGMGAAHKVTAMGWGERLFKDLCNEGIWQKGETTDGHKIYNFKAKNGYWVLNRCREAAMCCKSPMDFRNKFTSAAHKAINFGWYDIIRREMYDKGIWTEPKRWTEEEVAEIASNYKTRKEFEIGESGAYQWAEKNGLLDKVCRHMKRQASFTERYLYVFIFEDGNAYVGLAANPGERRKKHESDPRSVVYRHIHEKCDKYSFNVISDMMDYNLAAEMEKQKIVEYHDMGYTMLNIKKGGQLGSVKCKLKNDEIAALAKNCKTRTEFRTRYKNEVAVAVRRGIYEEICSHMPKPRPKTADLYSEDDIKRICSECKTLAELKRQNLSIYNLLRKQNRQWIFFKREYRRPWTENDKEEIMAILDECKTLEEVHKKHDSVYRAIFKFHWEEELLEFRKGRWHKKYKK